MSQNKSSYTHLQVEKSNNIAWIYLNRKPYNSLHPDLMEELQQVHQDLAQSEDIHGVILGSRTERFFCNGIDIEYLAANNNSGRKQAFTKLLDTLKIVFLFPKPHISIIEGHAMAGGAFLAMMSDFRYMADTKGRFCFSETSLGLSIPESLLTIISTVVHPCYLRQVAMEAYPFRPRSAMEVGLIDAVYPCENLSELAEKKLRKLLKNCSLKALIDTKKNMRLRLAENLNNNALSFVEGMDKFFDQEFEMTLQKIVQKR